MKTIIAEKPSVAREIAGIVGASDKKMAILQVTAILLPGHSDT